MGKFFKNCEFEATDIRLIFDLDILVHARYIVPSEGQIKCSGF